jgi:hypothetical protein
VIATLDWHDWSPFADSDIVIRYHAGDYDMHGTGIVRIFNGDGFVIASDGLRRDLDGNEVSANEQKVFNTVCAGAAFAYAATGVTYVHQGNVPFDVAQELKSIDTGLAAKQYDGAVRYIEGFAKALKNAFCEAQRNGRIAQIRDYGKGNLVTRVLFAGYYRRLPFMAQIELYRNGQEIEAPRHSIDELSRKDIKIEISGSEAVKQSLLSTDDLTFPAHELGSWDAVRNRRPFTIEQGVELARTYLDGCANPKGRKMDKECESIGGHIHIATVTPKDGFRWAEPPKPL